MSETELLAPAGDFQTALAAFEAGADAVYCGLNDFSARAFAKNLSEADLKNLMRVARTRGKKVYVTFNTILDEDQLDGAIAMLATLEGIGPDALIVQDLGIARLVRRHFPSLALHASTQLVAHNLEGVIALKELGFTRVVLARELSLTEITSIAKRCGDLELEVFIHGALCYSISGLCLFGAMEKGRSGNRGKCPYCCREGREGVFPFSMRDLRLGEDVRKLVEAGVASLKIEGRMKSSLYVASVTKYYRQILDRTGSAACSAPQPVTVADLETVFSRRTTKLYFDGRPSSPLDPDSLGHLGTEIGVVKRVTRDRDGLSWLRFHTARALEKHDGLQFSAVNVDGKHLGMGIGEMRQAISRRPVFEVNAGADVEVLLDEELSVSLKPGMKIYCSMSNLVRRFFPSPSFRVSDYAGGIVLDLRVGLRTDGISATAGIAGTDRPIVVMVKGALQPAKNPEKTCDAVKKAFEKLGGTDYRLGELTLDDPSELFAPMSVLNDLRRELVEQLDLRRELARREKIGRALADGANEESASEAVRIARRLKVRVGQTIPPGEWDEIIVAINADTKAIEQSGHPGDRTIRLALPVYTSEPSFNRLRNAVKRFLRAGFDKWEASDLATLRMLRALGITDITADWTLYAFNAHALAELSGLGVKRFVASPENGRENLQYLAESGYAVEFLVQQSTPLFISLTEPATMPRDLAVFVRDGLWVTTKRSPRTFNAPRDVSTRLDLSWDPS